MLRDTIRTEYQEGDPKPQGTPGHVEANDRPEKERSGLMAWEGREWPAVQSGM